MQRQHAAFQASAIVVVFDFATDTDAGQRGHQHQVTSRNRDVSAERRPLRADAFLDDLDQDLVATAKNFLDWRFDARASTFEGVLAAPPRLASPLGGRFGHLVRLTHDFFGIVSALAKVLRFDITDVQKSVSSNAEVDERCLNTRLQIDDLSAVDVPRKCFDTLPLHVKFIEPVVSRQQCGTLRAATH